MTSVPRVKVLAVTSTNPLHHYTWHLRVECMLPFLESAGIDVQCVRIPTKSADLSGLSADGPYDIVWLHRRTFYRSDVRRLQSIGRHLVLDIDDPVHLSSSNWRNFSFGRRLRFRATARACRAILAASPGLIDDARAYCSAVHHVPLCPDPSAYSMTARSRSTGEPLRLLWLGSKSTFKYLEGIRPHLQQVARDCREVELTVVGHSEFTLDGVPVHNVPWSAAADRSALDSCHVGLVPLPADRWTRSKAALKPLQYLSSGMPFIGSPVGIIRHLADDQRNGLLAETPAQWSEAVRNLQADEPRRFRMGTAGIEYVRKKHAPDVLGAAVAAIFRDIATR